MNAKTLLSGALLGFVAISVAYMIVKETGGEPTSPSSEDPRRAVAPAGAEVDTMAAAPAPDAATAPVQHSVVAYYFHGNYRCRTCSAMQEYAREALQQAYADALAEGRLEWRPVNTDEPENAHFIQDYQLATRSLVIAQFEGDDQVAYKNLERIWELVSDKEAFLKYVIEETGQYLAAG